MTEGHGDDLYRFGENSIKYNFSSNVTEPPRDIVEGLHEFIREHVDCIHHYPEPEPRRVEEALARHHGISPENVCVTNGATEAIYLIAQMLRGANTYIAEPTFSEYRDACRLHEHKIIDEFTTWDATHEAVMDGHNDTLGTMSYWLCNPNNPTGHVRPKEDIEAMVAKYNEATFVIDRSYGMFTNRPLLDAAEGVAMPNLVMIHSLTKHFAIPGLRIGYITGHKDMIARLKRMRMPWSVNAPAQESALYLLEREFPDGWFEEKLLDAAILRQGLQSVGIEVTSSDTHFLLCQTPVGTAAELKTWLAVEKGMLIRDASNFHGLSPRHFRVASQGKKADAALCEAVREWMSTKNQ